MLKNSQNQLRPIVDLIMNIAHWVKKSQIISFQDAQLHRREMQVLWLISKSNSCFSSQDLAEKLAITPGAITQLIDQMVLKGLVVRQVDQLDRRKSQLKISSQAEQNLRDLKRKHLESLLPIFSEMTDVELEDLEKLLAKISLPVKSKCCSSESNNIKNKETKI